MSSRTCCRAKFAVERTPTDHDRKSDTPTSGSNSGQLSGQGSHFARADDQPTTVTGTEPQTVGSSDNSASLAPASQARATAGPEAGGQSHIGTTSASSATPAHTDNTATTSTSVPSDGSASHRSGTATGTSFPPLESSKHGSDTATTGKSVTSTGAATDGSGTAAIGQTTTYSSRGLASGDPTSSVIDHESTDPLTYKFPEHGNDSAAGVPPGSAAAAAATAWKSQSQGEFSMNRVSSSILHATRSVASSCTRPRHFPLLMLK